MAEHCPACKWKDEPGGCPFFVQPAAGLIETNIATGEERFITGCFMQILPKLFIHVVRSANSAAASADKAATGAAHVAHAIDRARQLVAERRPVNVIEAPTDA